MIQVRILSCLVGVMLAGAAAAADVPPPPRAEELPPVARIDGAWRTRTWFVSVYGMRWAESRLPLLPVNAVTGRLPFRDAYLVAGAVNYVVVPRFDVLFLRGNSIELEGQIVKHFGFQDHVEGTAAVVLRSGQIGLIGELSANLGWANGVSVAFADPAFEFGPDGQRGVDSRRLQYYLGIESEFTLASAPNVHLVARLHHRSGVYGLISPQRTGSNFLGGGLRVDLQ